METVNSRIIAVEFQCKDADRTNEFYELIGLKLRESDDNIWLTQIGDYKTLSPIVVLVECEDVARMEKSLLGSGVNVIEPATLGLGGMTMIVADPDGRHVVLTEGFDKFKSRIYDYLDKNKSL